MIIQYLETITVSMQIILIPHMFTVNDLLSLLENTLP